MLTSNNIFEKATNLSDCDFIFFLWELKLLMREYICSGCGISAKFVSSKRNKDKYAWRCMNSLCVLNKQYFSLRKDSFFQKFDVSMRFILKVIALILSKQSQSSIMLFFSSKKRTIQKIYSEFIKKIRKKNLKMINSAA